MGYNGTIELIAGVKPANNGNFPMVNAKDVYVDDDTRLDAKLNGLDDSIDDLNAAVVTDATLSQTGKPADAKAVGDAINNITIEVDATLSQSGKAADAKATGDAVGDLKIQLNDGWVDLSPSTVKGYIAQPTSANVIEPTSYSAVYTGKLIWDKCNAGDKYKFTATGASGLFPYIITDNQGNVTAHGTVSQSVTDAEITITEDGYFGANQYGANDYVQKLAGIPKENKNVINTIKTEIEPVFEHKYIGTSETIDVTNPGTYSASYNGGYVFQKCSPGERFVLTISNIASAAYDVGIYNEEGTLLNHSLVGKPDKQLVDWTVVIPENGAYIGINVINNDGEIIYYKNDSGKIYADIWNAINILAFNPFKGKKGVAFGTSLTQRSDGTGTYGYLTALREILECDIENEGVGGAYWFLTDYSQRSITYNVEQYQDYADKDFVIIEGCVNDWFTSKVLGTYTDNVYTSVCGCLRKMINHVYSQKPTAQIFVILDHTGQQYTEELDCSTDKVINGKTQYEYYSELKKVCELCGIPVICEYSESSIGIYGTEYLSDNIHCNELGAKWSGTFIANKIKKIGLKVIS